MRVLDLTLKDLLQLVRDWKSAFFLVVMPVVFTLMFGFFFGGMGGGDGDPRLPVGLVDRDGGAVLSESLMTLLENSELVRPELQELELEELEQRVRDQELAAGLVIPAGYSEQGLSGGLPSLTLIVDASSVTGSTLSGEFQAAVNRLAGAVRTAELTAAEAGLEAGGERLALMEETVQEVVRAWQDPPLKVAVRGSSVAAEAAEEDLVYGDNSYSQSSAGMMVQFAMAGLVGAAEIIVFERKSRALQRLLTTAISRFEILLGHYLAMVVMLLVQFVLLVAFGQLLLGVPYLQEPVALLLVLLPFALWAAGMGLLIGVLSKDENQVVIFSLIPMFVLSGLGGAWMPIEFTPKAFQAVARLTPAYWAMQGLKDIIVRGQGVEAVLSASGILLAYAVAFFGLATWAFRRK